MASVDVKQYEENGTGCVIVAVSAGSEVIKDKDIGRDECSITNINHSPSTSLLLYRPPRSIARLPL